MSEILADINFQCGSTSASYPNSDKARNVNVSYHDVARLVWDSAGGWQYDDSNATTLPIATATLVHNQQDYELPSTAQKIEQIEVKTQEGNYEKLLPFDIHDTSIATSEYLETPGMPRYYDLIGRSVMLYPKPHSAYVTEAAGIKVHFDRDITELAATATTTEPGFAKPFHRILSYAASLDFIQDEPQRRFLLLQKDRLEKGLVRFYSKRSVERQISIRPFNKRRWRQFL